MRFLTIRTKITLWYTFFMVALVSAILAILVEATDMTILTNHKNQLMEVVKDAVEDVEEGDDFDFFDDGIFVLKYDEEHRYVEGSIPVDFSVSTPLMQGQVRTIKENGTMFYVYDQRVLTEDDEIFWVRGVLSDAQTNMLTKIILSTAFILLPVLVLLSSFIGYFITKRAFMPVRKIQETAQSITESNELSLRIGLPKGKDEISKLGETIDAMLEKLEKSFEQEKQFTSDASHELRTPVAVILAESEYILEHGEDMAEARESMEIINRQAEKMSALINQLLFFSRADQGRINLNLEKIDIVKAVEETAEDNKIFAGEKNISIKVKNNLESGKKYCVDKIMFIRAVQNIIQNAVVYGKENGYINIRIYENSNCFAVEVEDDGIGISRENLEKIWDRFYQADEARSRNEKGSMGLGLSMVKWITEKHGGYAEVKSVLGKGSTFTLFFLKK